MLIFTASKRTHKTTKLVCHLYKSVKFFFQLLYKVQLQSNPIKKKFQNEIEYSSLACTKDASFFFSLFLSLSSSLEEAKYRSIPEREGVDDARGAARYTP